MNHFDCTVEQRPESTLVARLSGSLGIAGGEAFQVLARELIERRPRRLVLDLSGVDFISSPGIALLIEIGRDVPERGGEVVIAGATANVDDALRRVRMHEMIPMRDDVEAALA